MVDASLIDRCQSDFGREVCGRLLEVGYRVIPQMKVGTRSIDLVVEGAEDRRLAIELDGDRFHGAERWADDVARQAALERGGWVFWRVFGSQWKADPYYWWCRLVEHLEQRGIVPIGSAAVNGPDGAAVEVGWGSPRCWGTGHRGGGKQRIGRRL